MKIDECTTKGQLIVFLLSQDDITSSDFSEVIKKTRMFGLNDVTLARSFKTSIPTIDRWARGITSPHPFMRASIKPLLIKLLESVPSIATIKVTFGATESDVENFTRIEELTSARSKAHAVAISGAFTRHVAEAIHQGGKVLIRDKHGKFHLIIMDEFDRIPQV